MLQAGRHASISSGANNCISSVNLNTRRDVDDHPYISYYPGQIEKDPHGPNSLPDSSDGQSGNNPDYNLPTYTCMADELPGPSPDELPGQIPDGTPGQAPDELQGQRNGIIPKLTVSNQRQHIQPIYTDEAIGRAASLIKYLWPSTTTQAESDYPEFCTLYNTIKAFNLPNFLGARIPVSSGLNIPAWRECLNDYHDSYLCEFLEFGWPIGYNLDVPPTPTVGNHPSASAHSQAIKDFISTELDYKAVVGPFQLAPFTPWFRTSPLMTRAKKGTNERRIIVDLSYPNTSAVNDGIDPTSHIGINITYTLPTIGDLITQLEIHRKGAFFWKADLRRAYRQIKIDPLDSPFLGIQVDSQIFIDRCPPFGCRSSASICQRMANGLVFIMAKDNHKIMAYLDDFGGCHPSTGPHSILKIHYPSP